MLNAIGGGETLFAKSERNETMKRQIKLLLDIMKSPLGTTKIQNFEAAITRELESSLLVQLKAETGSCCG